MKHICENCGNNHDGNYATGRFCSQNCANTRHHNTETKQKIRKKLLGTGKGLVEIVCKNCGNKFMVKWCYRKKQFCNLSCSTKYRMKNGLAVYMGKCSAKSQSEKRRSKNEIYFAELCEQHFNNIKTNEVIFNGWDADIILENEKIAVLWNGKWHYEKLNKKHSVKQVQNRDTIKIKEIKEAGYIPYVIKDMGKYNKYFVEEKFIIFKQYIAGYIK
jgi:hypothetical protein